jgi:uncharacterized protein YPO0396
MKSPYKIAKELSVSPQSVYQKIERLQDQLNPHIQRNGKKILIDEKGETLLKSTFLNKVEQGIDQEVQEVEQGMFNQLNKQLNIENEYLRKQNELLIQELSRERQETSKEREQSQIAIEKEREHSRQQAQSLAELSEKLAELTKNGQILLLKQEQENTLLLSDERPEENKKSLWQRIFKQKNK